MGYYEALKNKKPYVHPEVWNYLHAMLNVRNCVQIVYYNLSICEGGKKERKEEREMHAYKCIWYHRKNKNICKKLVSVVDSG